MSQLFVNVLDSNGDLVVPLATAMSASLTRELDGPGTVTVTFPAEDAAAALNITNEQQINIYVFDDDTTAPNGKRLLGSGIVRNVTYSINAGTATITITGPDVLDGLKRWNTWIRWTRDQQTVQTIIANLVAIASGGGWTSDTTDVPSLNNLSVRFDGTSVLKALQSLVKQVGIHFRLGDGLEVEAGDFGNDSGITLLQAGPQVDYDMYDLDVGVYEWLSLVYESEELVNRIVPLGPGDFEAALTLEKSTRSSPYTISNFTTNGLTHYYLEDSTSVTAYGRIRKVLLTGVAALSNSQADQVNAANASYDLAAAFLQRYSVIQQVFTVTVRNLKTNLKPGQKVRVIHKGFAYDENGAAVKYLDINADYWVLRVTERFDLSGRVVDLQLSNVDIPITGGARIVIGELEQIRLGNVIVKPYLSKDTVSMPSVQIGSTLGATLLLYFDEYTRSVNQVILRVWERRNVGSATGVQGMTVKFDGNTLDIGGTNSWSDNGTDLDLEFDITSYIDPDSFHGSHTVLIQTGSGSGIVNARAEIRETIQSIITN